MEIDYTLKTSVDLTCICLDHKYLQFELNYLRRTLIYIRIGFITKVVNEVKNDFNMQIVTPILHIETTDDNNNNIRKPMMILPYAGEKGGTLIKFLKKNLQRVLPTNIQTRVVYTGTKLLSQLKNVKDPTPFEE